MISPRFNPGAYLTVAASGLEPGVRYQAVWYGYRADDDPSPVRYSFRPQPCPPSGSLSIRAPYYVLGYYAQGEQIVKIRAFLALSGSEVPIRDENGASYCATWDTYEVPNLEPCEVAT